jgi:hypothetical protein
MTPLQLAGSVFAASTLLLPAATTTTVPRATTSLIALCSAAEQAPSPPRLRFSTRAGNGFAGTPGTAMPAAQRMPSMMSEV